MVIYFGSMEGVEIVIDDILVYGKILEEYIDWFKKVLEKVWIIGLKLNLVKCEFVKLEVDYVGYCFIGEGLKLLVGRVKVIFEMKDLEDRGEFEIVFGMLVYFVMFILRLSEFIVLLWKMKISEIWNWDVELK